MKGNKIWITLFLVGLGVLLTNEVLSQTTLPVVNTACKNNAGILFFKDKECPKGSIEVAIGEGNTGDGNENNTGSFLVESQMLTSDGRTWEFFNDNSTWILTSKTQIPSEIMLRIVDVNSNNLLLDDGTVVRYLGDETSNISPEWTNIGKPIQ